MFKSTLCREALLEKPIAPKRPYPSRRNHICLPDCHDILMFIVYSPLVNVVTSLHTSAPLLIFDVRCKIWLINTLNLLI